MKLRNKILLTLLAFTTFVIVPLAGTGAYWIRNVGLLPGTAVVFSDDAAAIDKMMVTVFRSVYGDRCGLCDGVDDQVEIQAAIDAVAGGEVVLLEGTFSNAAMLVIPANVTLSGQGRYATTLSVPDGTDGVQLNGDYAQIRDLAVVGRDTTTNVVGIRDRGAQTYGTKIINVRVYNWFRGICFTHSADHSEISGCYVDTVAIGMELWRSNFVKVAENSLLNILRNAIKLDGCNYSTAIGNTIYNWNTSGSTYAAIRVCNEYGSSVGMAIVGNILNSAEEDGTANGVVISGEGDDTNTVTDWIVADNIAIGLVGSSLGGFYNHSFDTDHDNVKNGTFSGNVAKYWTDGFRSAWGHGITWTGNVSSHSTANGFLLSRLTKGTLIGNVAKNNGLDGFRVQSNTTYTLLEGNQAYDDQGAPTQDYGINEFTTDCDHNSYTGNQLEGNVTGAMSLVGTNSRAYNKYSDLFMDVLAVTANHVVDDWDISGAGEIELNPAAANQPDVPRTTSWLFNGHTGVSEFDLVFEGIDAKGKTVTETFTEADVDGGWSGETRNAFAQITAIKYTRQADGGNVDNTIDIGITDVLGLSNVIYETGDVYKIKKDNVNVAVAGTEVDVDYDTYDMSVIGLAATNDFTIWYQSNLNVVT